MTIWGISLIVKKKINGILFKFFYMILYLIFTCILIHITFNNSFWLIDNGNSGFVGQILHNLILKNFPNINNQYIIFVFILFSLIFFFLASNININYFWSSFKNIFKFLNKKNSIDTQSNYIDEDTET